MKKLFFIFLTLLIFTSVSYASFPSFPVSDTLELKQETLQTEETKQYHSRLLKMGIDLKTCQCESCRKGIVPLTVEGNEVLKKNKSNIWINLLIIFSILSNSVKLMAYSKTFINFYNTTPPLQL